MRSSGTAASTGAKADLSPARTFPVQQPQHGLAATTARIFTFPVVIIQLVRVAWMIQHPPVGYERGAFVKNIGYLVAMVINGRNLLRGQEDHVFIAAGFSYLVGVLIPATTILRFWLLSHLGVPSGESFFPLFVHQVWGLCSLVATTSAFYAGFFEGRENSACGARSSSLQNDPRRDWPETIGGGSACTGEGLPENAPRSAKVTWYATIAVIAAHVALLVLPIWDKHSRIRSIIYVVAFSLPSGIVFVVGGILLRSYRKVTYRSAGYLYLLTVFWHVCRMRLVMLQTACLCPLVVAMVSAFWSCPALPARLPRAEIQSPSWSHLEDAL